MNNIDDDLITEATEYKREKKQNIIIKWGALAACLCLVAVGTTIGLSKLKGGDQITVGNGGDKIPFDSLEREYTHTISKSEDAIQWPGVSGWGYQSG